MKRKHINEQQLRYIISNILAEEFQRNDINEGWLNDIGRGLGGAFRGFTKEYNASRNVNKLNQFAKLATDLQKMGVFSTPETQRAFQTLMTQCYQTWDQMKNGTYGQQQNPDPNDYSGAAEDAASGLGYEGAAAAAGGAAGAADFGYGNYGGEAAGAASGLGYADGGAADAAFDGNNVMMPQDNTPQQYEQGSLFSDEEMAQQTVQPTQQPEQWTQGQFQFNTPQGQQLELPFTYDDDAQQQQQTDPRYNVQTNIGNPYVIDGVSESIARRRINGLVREAIQSILR